jgi:hypothetical protein
MLLAMLVTGYLTPVTEKSPPKKTGDKAKVPSHPRNFPPHPKVGI